MGPKRKLSFYQDPKELKQAREELVRYIQMKLTFMGLPVSIPNREGDMLGMAQDLIASYQEKNRLLSDHLCPSDKRIQDFIHSYFKDEIEDEDVSIPHNTFVLDRHGLARELSLPQNGHKFSSDLVESYRIEQGVLHNPKSDRRTTKGVFHICEGGLPIPLDKKAVPKKTYVKLLAHALKPTKEIMTLPFTSEQSRSADCFVSLLIRPIVVPKIDKVMPEKSMEIRFFAPGNLVSNLDFVESIFSNGGDPDLPANDAGLDVKFWTGHTGCVILAPQLLGLKKKDLDLPHISEATERQKRDGMCWDQDDEIYNDGQAFKITCRDTRGVIVTLIADNYFGYCKKEVKAQISYSANLFGLAEEEHAGGALVFPSYHLGFTYRHRPNQNQIHRFSEVLEKHSDHITVHPEGYAIDKRYSDLIYVPEASSFSVQDQKVCWKKEGVEQSIKLLPSKVYMLPTGYRIRLEKHPGAPSWRLVGTEPKGTLCHKPCTVSGGGKSEISKAFSDSYIFGPVYVDDYEEDMSQVQKLINYDYTNRFKGPVPEGHVSRGLLSEKRSLGSVIKLLTPSSEYADEYNQMLKSVPAHIFSLVFIIKRFYQPEWNVAWREHFTVDIVNGASGHELKFNGRNLVAIYVRMGFQKGAWRTYKLRQDFIASEKIQMEDDITASVIVPSEWLEYLPQEAIHPSVKLVKNCEYRLFQRPDGAIDRGFDKQAERDLARNGVFVSNFEPRMYDDAMELIENVVDFNEYTEPMRELVHRAAQQEFGYFVTSDFPRLVDGKPTKNPRYLQNRSDLENPFVQYAAQMGSRLNRKIKMTDPVYYPVDAVLAGHRNNPPDKEKGFRSLAVYNPIHYLDLPELFMDFICSITGRSPSTTGAGSEGAMTKGPFNALSATADLNNALVGYILTGYAGFFSAAGHIGPDYRVDHDVSLFVPEIWSRLSPEERDPKYMIENGYLEAVENLEVDGRVVEASRLGYRITSKFVHAFMGKIFDNPAAVFPHDLLRPEEQDKESFIDGVDNIIEAQKRVAQNYIDDGTIELACPPIRALLEIMATGESQGKTLRDPEIRHMFTRDYLLSSDWYKKRLETKRDREVQLWQSNAEYLKEFLKMDSHLEQAEILDIPGRLKLSEEVLAKISDPSYLEKLKGTIGADPLEV